ncbi:uncharacterized protein [Amphiura filiformis]|uniref:uncharacterized protein n=1 Tax=Amphiura filiformis TaxID=82378 RepID=UPI003B21D95C
MMKITLFAVIMLAAFFVKSWHSNAEYTVQGNHYMNNGIVPNNTDERKAFIATMQSEVSQLFKLQDPAALAAKYSDDCVYIHEDLGILRGRVAVQNAFQKLFASGKAKIEIEPFEETDIGPLGTDYMHVIFKELFFDKDNNKVGESKVFAVLKLVEDGFQTHLKAEITEQKFRPCDL